MRLAVGDATFQPLRLTIGDDMFVIEHLINQYIGQQPEAFDQVAAKMKNGGSSLHIRRQLVETRGISRLAAGKIVENVEKAIRAARVNLASGAGFYLLGLLLLLLTPYTIWVYVFMFVGTVQFAAGLKGWRAYRRAGAAQLEASDLEQPVPLTWKRLLRIWWAYSWRAFLVGIGAVFTTAVVSVFVGGIVGVFMGASGYSTDEILAIAQPLGQGIGFLIILSFSIIPMKLVLEHDFGDFRIALLPSEREEHKREERKKDRVEYRDEIARHYGASL